MAPDLKAALRLFDLAAHYSSAPSLRKEVDWQRSADFNSFDETDLLREAAWVILCSGFRERTVRQVFDRVSLCFCDWESAEQILQSYPVCRVAAFAAFGNEAKLEAIVEVARRIQAVGFQSFREKVLSAPIRELQTLPFIGPVTVWHLAKNLGLDVAKPDRHLVRISDTLGFESADHLCSEIAHARQEQPKVVDLMIWRYVADNPQSATDEQISKSA